MFLSMFVVQPLKEKLTLGLSLECKNTFSNTCLEEKKTQFSESNCRKIHVMPDRVHTLISQQDTYFYV